VTGVFWEILEILPGVSSFNKFDGEISPRLELLIDFLIFRFFNDF
jgi:hypothetical protein